MQNYIFIYQRDYVTITPEQKNCIYLTSYYEIYLGKENEFNYASLYNNKSLLNC